MDSGAEQRERGKERGGHVWTALMGGGPNGGTVGSEGPGEQARLGSAADMAPRPHCSPRAGVRPADDS